MADLLAQPDASTRKCLKEFENLLGSGLHKFASGCVRTKQLFSISFIKIAKQMLHDVMVVLHSLLSNGYATNHCTRYVGKLAKCS